MSKRNANQLSLWDDYTLEEIAPTVPSWRMTEQHRLLGRKWIPICRQILANNRKEL